MRLLSSFWSLCLYPCTTNWGFHECYHLSKFTCTMTLFLLMRHLEHCKSWLDEPGVCTPPYDLISHEHMPHELTKLSSPEDLQNKLETIYRGLTIWMCVSERETENVPVSNASVIEIWDQVIHPFLHRHTGDHGPARSLIGASVT